LKGKHNKLTTWSDESADIIEQKLKSITKFTPLASHFKETVPKGLMKLLEDMLQFDPINRPSIELLLRNPIFDTIRNKAGELASRK